MHTLKRLPPDTILGLTKRFNMDKRTHKLNLGVGELIREKVLNLVHQEVPHSIAVVVEQFKERPNNVIYILATIYTERASQKGIIIGNKGQMLKKIGELARSEIERLLNCKVYLDLYAKVRKNWRKNIRDLKEFGYY